MRTKQHSMLFFLLFSLLLTLTLLCLLTATEHLTSFDKTSTALADSHITVILDAGHGGEDGGAIGQNGVYEKDLNLDIAKAVGAYLTQSGIPVVYTRTEDVLLYDRNVNFKGRKKILDLAARLKVGKETENAVFVSIHMNAFPQIQYSGLQVYYSKNDKTSKIMAQTIQNNAKNLLQPNNDRKTKQATSAIYLLDRLEKPAVLIECGFLSNPEESRLLATPEYRQKLSLVIAQSIAQYLAATS